MRSCLMLYLLGAVLWVGAFAPPVAAVDADAILGRWYTAEEKAVVEIYPCGSAYCGRIVWLKEPLNADGTEKRDIHHPDPDRRSAPILGLELVSDFRFDGAKAWRGGRIYDPENGKTYGCKMTLDATQGLKVRGYIGVSLLGRTQIWTRAPRR